MHQLRFVFLLILMIGFIKPAETASYQRATTTSEYAPTVKLPIKKQKHIHRKHKVKKKSRWDIRNLIPGFRSASGTKSLVFGIIFGILAIVSIFVELWILWIVASAFWSYAGMLAVNQILYNGWDPGDPEFRRAIWALSICALPVIIVLGYLGILHLTQ